MSRSPAWEVEHARGPAAALHARPLPEPAHRLVSVLEVERPALVLGSTQPAADADAGALDAAGVDLVRRQSGGGAVLLVPGESLWIDVLVPRGDPLWDDDVGHSFHWLGRTWVATLAGLGIHADVQTGAMVCGRWCRLVCFGGLGPGEVTVEGAKLVGIAQRRGRPGARYQCTVAHHWDPQPLLRLLHLPPADRAAAMAELAGVGAGLGRPFPSLVDSFLAALP